MSVKTPTETVEVEVSYTAYDELAEVCTETGADPDDVVEALLTEYADGVPKLIHESEGT